MIESVDGEPSSPQFLQLPELDVLSHALNLSTPTLKVSTRIEAYSCKAIARERKLFKALETELIQDLSHSTSVSPPEQHQILLESAFGPLDQPASRKTLWMLIGLLNVAFPDHDFSRVHPEEFRREESARAVLSSLSSALDHHAAPAAQRSFSAYQPASSSPPFDNPFGNLSRRESAADHTIITHPFLRQVLDPIIDLADCEVFSYTPDMDSDPHAAESDDEEEDEEASDAFEKDDDGMGGMVWEMDGLEGHHRDKPSSSSRSTAHPLNSNRSRFIRSTSTPGWTYGGPPTPMKSFSSFLPPVAAPGTPTSNADSDDYFREASSGGLLWSSNYFLFNKKKKRILFISLWAKKPEQGSTRAGGRGGRAEGRRALSMRNEKRKGLRERAAQSDVDSFHFDLNTATIESTASNTNPLGRVPRKRAPAIGSKRRIPSKAKI